MSLHQKRSRADRAARRVQRLPATMPRSFVLRGTLACAVPLLVAACATQPVDDRPPQPSGPKPIGTSPALSDAVSRAQDPNFPPDRAKIYRGSGVVVKGQQAGGVVPGTPQVQAVGSAVVLNFEA